MLDMDARDIEDLGELLQILQESQRTKRPGQDDTTAEGAKKARVENREVRPQPASCHATSAGGQERKK